MFFPLLSSTASVAQRSRRLTSPNFHCFLFLRIFSLPCAIGAWMGIFSMSRSLFLLWVFTMPAASLRTVMGDDGSMDPGGLYYRWIWPGLTPGSSISQQSQHTAYYTFQSGTWHWTSEECQHVSGKRVQYGTVRHLTYIHLSSSLSSLTPIDRSSCFRTIGASDSTPAADGGGLSGAGGCGGVVPSTPSGGHAEFATKWTTQEDYD